MNKKCLIVKTLEGNNKFSVHLLYIPNDEGGTFLGKGHDIILDDSQVILKGKYLSFVKFSKTDLKTCTNKIRQYKPDKYCVDLLRSIRLYSKNNSNIHFVKIKTAKGQKYFIVDKSTLYESNLEY